MIYAELQAILPGCEYIICGGYRRGKPMSNDVDIVYTHRSADTRGVLEKLVRRLTDKGNFTEPVMSYPCRS
jgi:DNA polymerase IV